MKLADYPPVQLADIANTTFQHFLMLSILRRRYLYRKISIGLDANSD